jgi:phenylalanyl-tRNA synthetase beta chain
MRVPVSWLREYVELGDGPLSAERIEEIDAALVRVGLEVEAVHRHGEDVSGPLVVGEVREITELTEFKKPIRHCLVDVGEAEPRSIVCGATNFAVGDWVVVSLPGAVLPGGFVISSRETYGHLSDGMICSLRELGLGDDHTGILVLPRAGLPDDVRPGSDAIALLELVDTVIELAITPDRGYCFSIRGVARELAHGLGIEFHDPGAVPTPAPTDEPPHPVRVVDTAGCDRFVARAVTGIDPATPTPLWMRRRLLLAGVRSISLAVDVTNYLMLELGQPMHAFDLARLTGPIVVRRGQPAERVRTLDGTDRAVHPEDLLITDDTGPIGLAAVMGGATTEVSDRTTDVLIECAHWDPVSVARAARRHKLPSEASKRFERGVDPEMAPVAAERAVQLLAQLAGGTADPRVLDLDYRKPVPAIRLDVALPSRIAGVTYEPATVQDRLREIGCAVTGGADSVLDVVPPTWRPDLTAPIDLVEEVIRISGYDAVPSVLPPAPASAGLTPDQRRRRTVARTLAEAGYVEVLCYPFVSPTVHDAFGLDADDPRRVACRLANPISEEEPELRTSLLPGLLKAVTRNTGRGQRDLALFEIGLVYRPDPDGGPAPRLGVDRRPSDAEVAALLAAVPAQPRHVGAVLTGERDPHGWWGAGRGGGWADAVEAARLVGVAAGADLRVRQGQHAPWHPGRCAELVLETPDGDLVVGYAGEMHPGVLAKLDLPARTCAMELDLDALPLPGVQTAPELSTFPPALIDVALVVPDETPAAAVGTALAEGAGELLESMRLFDVFTGPQLGDGRKSLAYALTFRAPDRTLTVEEATAARDAAVAEATRRTGAVLRG